MEVGNKVKCIDDQAQSVLKLDQIYEIEKVDGHKIFVKGYKRYSFLKIRFEVCD